MLSSLIGRFVRESWELGCFICHFHTETNSKAQLNLVSIGGEMGREGKGSRKKQSVIPTLPCCPCTNQHTVIHMHNKTKAHADPLLHSSICHHPQTQRHKHPAPTFTVGSWNAGLPRTAQPTCWAGSSHTEQWMMWDSIKQHLVTFLQMQ